MTSPDAMQTVLDLEDDALQRIMRAQEGEQRDLQAAFERFHAANPGVYEALVRLARRARAAGHEHIGIGMLWEVLRWEMLVGDPLATDGYRLNNNHRSMYARLIMEQEGDLEGMFETRRGTWVS